MFSLTASLDDKDGIPAITINPFRLLSDDYICILIFPCFQTLCSILEFSGDEIGCRYKVNISKKNGSFEDDDK